MTGLTVEVINLQKTAEALASLGPKAMAAAAEAALNEADRELGLSLQIVPFRTGALYGTGRVETPTNEAGEITAAIAYGDETVDYALAVHEDLEAHYSPPGEAKYLERPVREETSSGRAVERMREDIWNIIDGLVKQGPRLMSRRAIKLMNSGGKK